MISIRLDRTSRHMHLYASIYRYMPDRPMHIHLYAFQLACRYIHLYASFDSPAAPIEPLGHNAAPKAVSLDSIFRRHP